MRARSPIERWSSAATEGPVTHGTAPDQGKLSDYVALVRRYADRFDLVAPGDIDRFQERHVQDSLRLVRLVYEAPPGPCVDVGSGAGLPGVPLAIATNRHWRLLEPRRKRAGFLEEVVRELDLDAEVLVATAEQAAADPGLARSHSVAVARALAPPDDALRLVTPLVAPSGWAALFVGQKPVPEGAEEWEPGIATMRGPAHS